MARGVTAAMTPPQSQKGEITPFPATRMDPSPRKGRQILGTVTHVCNLNYGTNELIRITETDSRAQRTDLQLCQGGVEGAGAGRRGMHRKPGLGDTNYHT